MVTIDEKQDTHVPLFVHDYPLRRQLDNPKKYCSYVTAGQVVADLGCGTGHYTIGLAECVGPEGKVYAVDSDEKAIQRMIEKARQRGLQNIEAYPISAHDLPFIPDGSVDFILACNLLCAMAPQYHASAANEMQRILKSTGRAYLSAAKGSTSHLDQATWEEILARFTVERRDDGMFSMIGDRLAVVSSKQR